METNRPIGPGRTSAARPSRRASLAAALGSAAAFAFLAWNAVAGVGLVSLDPAVQRFVVEHRVEWATDALTVLTWLGSTLVLAPVAVVSGLVVLVVRRDWLSALLPGIALLVTVLAKNGAKMWIGRPRPDPAFALVSSTGSAFPSGHAADSLALYMMVALMLSVALGTRARWTIWLATGAAILVVGASRVYLGVHWLTDVLGGWALGASIVWFLVAIFGRSRVEGAAANDGSVLRPPAGPARS